MGNPASLDRLVLDHLPAVLRFATRLTGDADRGEDLVQESLLRAVRRWASFRGEADFRTWLFRIVINVFRDRMRAAAAPTLSIQEDQVEMVDSASAGPPAAAIALELERLIAQEVSRLPPRQREVLVLIAFEGMSANEVAEVVGISVDNVHSTLSGARARLRLRLAHYIGSVEK
ncbi:MAG: RNA polymerase sigma factor [Pirellulales bacterium]